MNYKSIQLADKPVHNSYVSCHNLPLFQNTLPNSNGCIASTSSTGTGANDVISTTVRRVSETETSENYDTNKIFQHTFQI
jgi:hypothetical protein